MNRQLSATVNSEYLKNYKNINFICLDPNLSRAEKYALIILTIMPKDLEGRVLITKRQEVMLGIGDNMFKKVWLSLESKGYIDTSEGIKLTALF